MTTPMDPEMDPDINNAEEGALAEAALEEDGNADDMSPAEREELGLSDSAPGPSGTAES